MDYEKLYETLSDRLQRQKTDITIYRKYYDGEQTLAFATSKYREKFSDMLAKVVDNWCPIIVDAVEERLHVQGFRFTDEGVGDNEAESIWQYNHLDSESELLHSETLITGVGHVLVWQNDGEELPTITIESSDQVYVMYGNGNRRRAIAAIKKWQDEWTGEDRAILFTPDTVFTLEEVKGRLTPVEEIRNPIGKVPIVTFFNRPKVNIGSYRSELFEAISTQDQINKILADAILASEFAAFRQRWATGVEVPIDPDTNKPVEPFESAINRMFVVPDPEARFGTFEAADLGNYVKLMENRIQSLASRTRTPAHYLLGQSGSFPSGESLKATETGLIAKVRSRQRHYGESWENALRLAFAIKGDQAKAAYFKAEVIWSDPESRSESEHVDALVKLRSLNVPLRVLWSQAGYSEVEIDRFVNFMMEERLTQSFGNPVINLGALSNGASDTSPNSGELPASTGGTSA